VKRKLHRWRRRKRDRPDYPYVDLPPAEKVAPMVGEALRCFCPRCKRMDKREKWGAWQMSLLPLMGVADGEQQTAREAASAPLARRKVAERG
jgi:hypothetical protein